MKEAITRYLLEDTPFPNCLPHFFWGCYSLYGLDKGYMYHILILQALHLPMHLYLCTCNFAKNPCDNGLWQFLLEHGVFFIPTTLRSN